MQLFFFFFFIGGICCIIVSGKRGKQRPVCLFVYQSVFGCYVSGSPTQINVRCNFSDRFLSSRGDSV